MNKNLIEYLEKRGAKPLDEDLMKEYAKSMKERTIPEIEKEHKRNAQLAAERRFRPGPFRKRKKDDT